MFVKSLIKIDWSLSAIQKQNEVVFCEGVICVPRKVQKRVNFLKFFSNDLAKGENSYG